jgi:hypothetical protein
MMMTGVYALEIFRSYTGGNTLEMAGNVLCPGCGFVYASYASPHTIYISISTPF